MTKILQKTIPIGLLILVLYSSCYPALAQAMAMNSFQKRVQPPYDAGKTKKLSDVLKELKAKFAVDILFEGGSVEGISVSPDVLSPSDNIERSLEKVLQATNLYFKKVKNNSYVIIENKTNKKRADLDIRNNDPSFYEKLSARNNQADVSSSRNTEMMIQAPEQIIKGKVTDGLTGESLPGVSIMIKGTSKGVSTDIEGDYTISVDDPKAVLIFSFIGYELQEVVAGNRTIINIQLKTDTKKLEEVVVVGYGTIKKSDLTGSVSSINSTELKKTQMTSLDQGLQGRASGVQVTQSNGQPGGGISIRVRGGNSITGNNEPLYVIDGFPVFNDQSLNAGVNLGAISNPLSTINPSDIESIEVLKDASATAIYGARGANGVVMITTKRGKSGNAKIDYETFVGTQQVIRTLPMLNARQYGELINDARVNAGLAAFYSAASLDSLDRVGSTNWQNEIFRNATMHSHQLTISGGTDQLQYAVSGNFLNQDGIIINSGFQRSNLRLNLDARVNKFLKIGTNTLLSQTSSGIVPTDGTGVTNPGVIWSAHLYSPLATVKDPQGNYTYRNVEPALGNPVAYANLMDNKNASNRVLTNIYAEFTLAKDLVFKINGGQDLTSSKESLYVPGSIYLGETTKGMASVGNVSIKSKLLENTLAYQKSFVNTHQLNALLGYTVQTLKTELSRASSQTFPNDIIGYNDLAFGTTYLTPASQINSSKIISYLGRINYGYKGRYLFTGTMRIDGSTRFGDGNKYGTFPSGSVAWRVIEESFMKSSELFSDLKLRASYGLTGNQEIGLYRSLPLLSNYGTAFGNSLNIGIAPSNIPNPGLKWEMTGQFDVGLDAAMFNNRLQLSGDYYIKNTKDLLLNVTLPLTSGYASTLKNIGKVRNKGWEFSATTVNIDKKFKWSTTINLASNKNEVIDLGSINQFYTGQSIMTLSTQGIVKVGEPVGTFFGRVTDGIFQNQSEIDNSAQKTARPGDRRYKDLNNDGVINDNDRTIIGNSQPKLFGGITNNFSYKGFDVSLFFNAVLGNRILNVNKFRLYTLGGGAGSGNPPSTGNNSTDVLDRWSPTNPSQTIPRANTTYAGDILSDFQIEDGSFLRLKNVSVGYNLPSETIKKMKMRTAKIYFSGQNLLTFTKYSGYDPEVSRFGQNATLAGIDFGGYPISKMYTIGLNVGF